MPASKLQHRSHILNYHCTREALAKGIIKFVNMNGNDNTADIVTKIRVYNTWYTPTKPILFWCDMDFIKERFVANGSEKRSSIHPLSLNLRELHISTSSLILGIF